jgi:hypothetical protein
MGCDPLTHPSVDPTPSPTHSSIPTAIPIPLANGLTLPATSGDNVVTLTVNGSTCSNPTYPNKPCVAVTVCDASNTCKTINDILLDTGSYGLRIFNSVLSEAPALNLDSVTSGANPVAECVQYGDGSKQWGPVKIAKVQLGNEPFVTVPIQAVDSNFAGMNAKCGKAMDSPAEGGMNGILGLGLFQHDCGLNCAISANNGNYYSCNTSTGTCVGASVPLAKQVQNPVPLLPLDHNGVILKLPDLPAAGATSVDGYLILGIGTRSNNIPDPSVKTFDVDASFGEFYTRFQGQDLASFIDSGSNSLSFPYSGSSLPICASPFAGWFCPSSFMPFSADTISSSLTLAGTVSFEIGNFRTFYASSNAVSKTTGADSGTGVNGYFDWGLPFYLGRNVYHGIEGQSSSLGAGPYWAY